jgi:hypothetical protein
VLDEAALIGFRDRFAVERLDAVGLDGTCMVCFAFRGFQDGTAQQVKGHVYYPPDSDEATAHAHATHPQIDRDQAQVAVVALRAELTELAETQPDFADLLERAVERLADLTEAGLNPARHISEAARLALHVRRLVY